MMTFSTVTKTVASAHEPDHLRWQLRPGSMGNFSFTDYVRV